MCADVQKVMTPLTMCAIALASHLADPAALGAGGPADFTLVRHDLSMQDVAIAGLSETDISFFDEEERLHTIPMNACLALFRPDGDMPGPDDRVKGLLTLADGQRFSGHATSSSDQGDDLFVWMSVVGRLEVPLSRIASVAFVPDAIPAEPRETDVVVLGNGDRIDGFLVSAADPVVVETETADGETDLVEVRRDNVRSITMVTPPARGRGQRIWVRDGSVMDVAGIEMPPNDSARSVSVRLVDGDAPGELKLAQIQGICFAPDQLMALASIAPRHVEGPVTRYFVPRPQLLSDAAPLDLAPIEFRGPLLVRYVLPGEARRFAAVAVLPEESHQWGDVILSIRDDDAEVFRATLNADSPRAMINTSLSGAELTIELEEGANGPIQDRIILHQAILLAGG